MKNLISFYQNFRGMATVSKTRPLIIYMLVAAGLCIALHSICAKKVPGAQANMAIRIIWMIV